MYIYIYIYIYDCLVTIILTTLVAVEKTLFSIATRSRQIEKRLFLGMTFGTSSLSPPFHIDVGPYTRQYVKYRCQI